MRHIDTFLIIVESKAFITTESNKSFSGQQPRQLVERRVNRRFGTVSVHVIRETEFSYSDEKNTERFIGSFHYCQPQ